jgi:biotin carboxylase
MANPAKRVLLFAAKLGYQTRMFDAAAKKLGVELAFVTDRCHQLDDPWGDRAQAVHFETPEAAAYEVVQQERLKQVDGILALGDRPAAVAAYAAPGFGILFHHPAGVEVCRDKFRMREVFREAGIPTPWFRNVPLTPAPEPALLGITYPCVLKPLSLSASQGVVRANNREEFMAGTARLKRLLDSAEIQATRERNLDRMLVEEYLPGREVAVEALVTQGTVSVLAIFDKPDPLEGPYFEETIYVTPSRLPEETRDAIRKSLVLAVQSLGLGQGPVHAEFRVNEDGVWPLEVAARPIGGLCAKSLRFVVRDGEVIGLEELLLRHALGMEGSDAPRETLASGVMMIPVPKSGVFEGVEGEEEARGVSDIVGLEITARIHDYLAAWPEGSSYLGFLFARAERAEDAEAAIREAYGKLRFTMTARLPVEHPITGQLS